MTLLRIVGDACSELGIPRPSGVIGNTDPTIVQLFAILRRFGQQLCEQHDWQQLVRNHTIVGQEFTRTLTTTRGSMTATVNDPTGITRDFAVSGAGLANNTTVSAVNGNTVNLNIPALSDSSAEATFSRYRFTPRDDYDHMLSSTFRNRDGLGSLGGPVGAMSNPGWAFFESSTINMGLINRFRIRHGKVEVMPAPKNLEAYTYAYSSKSYIYDDTGEKQDFTADSDRTIFPLALMVHGLLISWKQTHGIDASFEIANFNSLLQREKSQNSPGRVANLAGFPRGRLISNCNIPEGSWNV